MFKDLFGKPKYVTVKSREKQEREDISPDSHLWTKCSNCNAIVFNKKLVENLMVCSECNYHFRISARDRLAITVDEDSFQEFGADIHSEDPLDFPDYKEKLLQAKIKTGLDEAVLTGEAVINGFPVVIGVMDFTFMGGSMGSVVGEKITLAVEKSLETKKPLVLITTAGGARMQEGLVSLMQMAKTSAAVKKLDNAGILYICIMTDPTSGGVTASFASIADIIMAESGALIAFAGPRVIKQTISADLPEGFQRAEFLLEHGMVDMVVDRKDMKSQLARILMIHQQGVRNCG